MRDKKVKKQESKGSRRQKPARKRSSNKEFARITYIFVGLFLALMGYIVYFNAVESTELANNAQNTRTNTAANRVTRGNILAGDGKTVLAENVSGENGELRNYPYGDLFAHTVGYASHGRAGIESIGNAYLTTSSIDYKEKVINEFKEQKNAGDDIVTTLDVDLQQISYDALGSNKGAVVVLEPSTGKVLAMASNPTFNPNELSESWDTLVESENSELYNRAAQGLYAPGSTFKVVTALAYMRENSDYENFSYNCTSKITQNDLTINCYHKIAHGNIGFSRAFAKSCNTSFVQMGMDMNASSFRKTSEELLFNKELPFELPASVSKFPVDKKSVLGQRMLSAIGQAEVEASPLHIAMIAAAVANDGVLMKPYVMDSVINKDGKEIENFGSEEYGELMTKEEAKTLQGMMKEVVDSGTGDELQSSAYNAAGKTGTAEFSSDKDKNHAWFMGYADNGDKEIAITVIAEGAGSGSDIAVPMTKKILDAYFK